VRPERRVLQPHRALCGAEPLSTDRVLTASLSACAWSVFALRPCKVVCCRPSGDRERVLCLRIVRTCTAPCVVLAPMPCPFRCACSHAVPLPVCLLPCRAPCGVFAGCGELSLPVFLPPAEKAAPPPSLHQPIDQISFAVKVTWSIVDQRPLFATGRLNACLHVWLRFCARGFGVVN
jgi:hypothetical protein